MEEDLLLYVWKRGRRSGFFGDAMGAVLKAITGRTSFPDTSQNKKERT